MASGDPRAALEEAVRHGLRALMTRAVVFNHEVAERTGLNLTDLQCLGLLQLQGPMSAGALARGTGLTTSAITAAIDRLERSGYAAREHDATDRRRVIVKLDEKQLEDKLLPLYASEAAGRKDVLARFGDEELATVREFLRALEEASATRAQPDAPG
ncbi:MarR family transcriptional regulator [Actinoallomurus bryophytorum]|uniref:DNA-binding MarR family transcriptional regulator n=1 Tax=Actinoallomurus bryophytorum TaxID=1490222 RepID=A0A543CWS1_9ACTN|nr:MarR family transcriptional regulator [Actinoallomurus bryophytorum]TQM01556.1 DNA-binding MarR family transcriptional regulator [Actinoallomurus bryophytorum]